MDNATFSNMKHKLSVWNNDVTVKRALHKMLGRGRSRSHGRGGYGHGRGRGSGRSSHRSRNNDNDSSNDSKPEKVEFTPHYAGKTQGATHDTVKKQTMHDVRGSASSEMT